MGEERQNHDVTKSAENDASFNQGQYWLIVGMLHTFIYHVLPIYIVGQKTCHCLTITAILLGQFLKIIFVPLETGMNTTDMLQVTLL